MRFLIVPLVFLSLFTSSKVISAKSPQPLYTNSLINETSPYLLQHAHNPVNWFAWNKKAFELAKKLNKPIFLSIGYSTCHWCHVMEKESFENLEVAKILNQSFISIKVDREQRPDIDALYMQSLLLQDGRGGWPLNVFITPEGDFFYGGSYFPPSIFKELLLKIDSLWKKDQNRVTRMAKSISEIIKKQQLQSSSQPLTQAHIDKTINSYINNDYDDFQGGFSQAPKFPNEAKLFLLLDSLSLKNNEEIFNAIETTLNAMSNGGIYDHIGGGFHRYSTDDSWFVPHFEKMLYNQAHLASIYMKFYQLSNNNEYAEIAKQTIEYVLKDMQVQGKTQGFYSASDADSRKSIDTEAEEGVFFIWHFNELKAILTNDEFQLLSDLYGISEKGNYTEAGEGKNIIFRLETLSQYANNKNIALNSIINSVNFLREKLYQIRNKRLKPHIDKKIVTSWNAMMISTLIQAAQIFENTAYKQNKYLTTAIEIAHYLNNYNINNKTQQLLRNSIGGKQGGLASQDDYAYFIKALIDLYDQTNNKSWLQQAQGLMQQMIDLFWDDREGAFFQNNPLQEVALSSRLKDSYDGAIPAGNSIAMEALNKLISRTRDQKLKINYQLLRDKMLDYYGSMSEQIESMPYMLMVLQKSLQGETSLIQYGAYGHLKAQLVKTGKNNNYQLKISLDETWHINSNSPLQRNLIKTKLSLVEEKTSSKIVIKDIVYPQAIIKKLGFSRTKLSLYENDTSIDFKLKFDATNQVKIVPLEFRFQACSENTCLAPEKLKFNIPLK